jgi:GH25 family lysozyme M1 (1,4-beta-N-acetylmuramidase)
MLYGVDISVFQGDVDWNTLNSVSNFVIIRATYGTVTDPKFSRNQSEARRVRAEAGPLGIGYYHYAYARLLDAITSADYFVDTLGPLNREVLALDWEEPYSGDHVAWCLEWLKHVEARTGIKPLIYLNQSLMNAHNWSPVIDAGYGLWLAAYNADKASPPPPTPWPVVAMRQWTSSDFIGGIAGKVDGDTFYGDFTEFEAYGSVPQSPAPVSVPADPLPDPVSAPNPTPALPVDSVQPAPVTPLSPPPVAPPVSGPVVVPPVDLPVAPVVDPLSGPPKNKGVPIPVNLTETTQTVSKAIAGGVTSMILTVLARYGFDVGSQNVTLLGIAITAVVAYAIGHVVVYFAPRNVTK